MSAPTSRFSRLSLEAMTPTTRSHALASQHPSSPSTSGSEEELNNSSNISDSDTDPESSPSSTIRSPSKLTYLISHLPQATQSRIRDVFTDPPQLALQRCRLVNSTTYAFQMTELVTRSVRIRAKGGEGEELSCSCGGGQGGEDSEPPCEHLIWLLDKVTEQTLYEVGKGAGLKMTEVGYTEELGNPFKTIADHDLNVIGPGLHCPVVGSPASNNDGIDIPRLSEARELLASIHGEPIETFRPDLVETSSRRPGSSKTIKHGDIDATILRMLLDNHHFFQYFLSKASRSDSSLRDPFRKISQRVDRILQALDDASLSPEQTSPTSARHLKEQQPPRDVPWAATHILGCTTVIRSSIFTRSRPLSPPEALSAARTLTHILTTVISRNYEVHSPSSNTTTRTNRNLYLYLIGDQDRDFIIGVLSLIPAAASQFLDSLEGCLDGIGTHGAPAGYAERFRKLLERLRTSGAGGAAGVKRSGATTAQDATARGRKRMK